MLTDCKSDREMASADVLPLSSQYNPAFKVVQPGIKQRKRKWSESTLSSSVTDKPVRGLRKINFDSSKHLSYVPPSKVWSMEEIGLSDQGISHNAVSEPFQLFTPEAIHQMRGEVLSKKVVDNCQYSSNLAQSQLRGMAPE